MGTPAYVQNGTMGFDDPKSAAKAFTVINKWVKKATMGTLPEDQNGDYGIENLELNAGKPFITFSASSSRYQNLEWQMENLLKVCKPLKGIEYFDAPIMIESDNGISWCAEDEE